MVIRPSNVHSIREVLERLDQLASLKACLTALPATSPDLDALNTALGEIQELEREAIELARIMDQFNELLAPQGWIVHDWLDTNIAKAAVHAAESGDMGGAELILIDYYEPDLVRDMLQRLDRIRAFTPRRRLAELAAEDYRCARYHACVPVVLALLDGMVNELGIQGFFGKGADLVAWDSIAANDAGLMKLKGVFDRPRKTTTVETISIPYRHGILHGMDLGYDNQMVAAKCWAALFACADWARRVEQGKKDPPSQEPELKSEDFVALLAKNKRDNARLAEWKPRDPDKVDLSCPTAGTPEEALVQFLNAWKVSNYGEMARILRPFNAKPQNARAGDVRAYYTHFTLREFAVVAVRDQALAVTEIEVQGCGVRYGLAFNNSGIFRLVYMDATGSEPGYIGQDGAWFLMNWDPWNSARSPVD